jgi:alpha-1,6-mannosyltransferase
MTTIAPRSDGRSKPSADTSVRSVLVIGIASGLLYVVVARAQRWIQSPPSKDASSTSWVEPAVFVTGTLALFALFVTLLLVCAKSGLPSRKARVLVIAFPVVYNLLFVLVPPRLSIDLLSYISHGYIEATLDANPLVKPSSIVADTPLGPELARYGWRPVHPASPYGPLWTRVEAAIVQAVHGVRLQMVVLKLVVVAASLGSALLIWHILAYVRPDQRSLGTLSYLWNPLIVVEIAGEGHNDSVMVFLVLLALFLTIRGRGGGGLVAMSLGVLTKYLPLFLLPLQIVHLWHARVTGARFAKQVAIGVAVGAALTLILFGGLWAGPDTLTGVRASAQSGSTGSTPTMIVSVVTRLVFSPIVETVVEVAVVTGFVVFLGRTAASVTGMDHLLRACASVSLVYVLLVSPAYWPWYAVMPAALLALVPSRPALLLLLAISVGSRLVAPLDMLYVHGVMDRMPYFMLTWILGLGSPILVAIASHARGKMSFASIADERPGSLA